MMKVRAVGPEDEAAGRVVEGLACEASRWFLLVKLSVGIISLTWSSE